jgi:uncharacterized protein with PIN domain
MPDNEPTFACDAMLGGLARWLRAAGYDASWTEGIDDWDLVRLARREGRVLLSSDTGIFKIGVVRDGDVPALFVPHGMGKQEQLAFVVKELRLQPLPPRCMACGGTLREVPPEHAQARVPERTFAWVKQFFECRRCGHLYWPGSHWQRIADTLRQAVCDRET